jgi:hypothetical protein
VIGSLKSRLTSAHVMALVALVLAAGGSSFAVAALSHQDKKVVKKIAKKQVAKQIKKRAPGLSVGHASTADTATSAATANTAASADAANSAETATTATSAQSASIASALTPPEPVHLVGTAGEFAFNAPWVNGSLTAGTGFFMDKEGIVHLQGRFTGGVSLTAAFALPEGYRPNGYLFLPASDTVGEQAIVRVEPGGDVVVICSSNCNGQTIGIDGLSFRAATG